MKMKTSKPVYLAHPRLYGIYSGMIDRCLNPSNSNFANYGGRGITVSLKWIRTREAFIQWALENGYESHLTIDRIDVNKGYYPENCRWATMKQQANNTRRTKRILFNGERKPLTEWCELFSLNYQLVFSRLYRLGWDVEDAFNPDIYHEPKTYSFNGKLIYGSERQRLLEHYKYIIDRNYSFVEAPPSGTSKAEKIKKLAEVINEHFSFYDPLAT